MGKGKKKGKKESEGEVPSVSRLSISEEAPSTSQAPEEEEESGLGLGSRKKQRKQKQAEAKAALAAQSGTPSEGASTSQVKPEQRPEPEQESPQPEPEQKPASKVEPKPEVKEPTSEDGLGLTGAKKRSRKKKSLAAVEAETGSAQVPSGAPMKPIPEQQPGTVQLGPQAGLGPPGPQLGPQAGLGPPGPQLGPQAGLGPSGPQLGQAATPWQAGRGRGTVPFGRGQPGPHDQAGRGQPGPLSQAGRGQPGPLSQAGRGQPGPQSQAGQGAPWQAGPRPAGPPAVAPTSVPPQRPQQPVATPSMSQQMVPVTSSKFDPSIRYKIPAKILGNTVRHHPTRVITNYLPMTFKLIKVYRYDCTVKPDRPKKMFPIVFKTAEKLYYPNQFIAFDQAKNCYALNPLKNVPLDGSDRHTVMVDITDPNGRVIKFEVSFKATGIVDFSNIRNHMDSGGSSLNTPSEEIQCIDVILRQGALESYVKCGRQFFKRPANPINLTGGLEIWTGLFQSAIFTSRAYINIDVAHKGFPIQQSLIDALTQSFRLSTDRRLEEQRSFEIENFESFLKGLRVVATLVGPPNNGQTREFTCNGLVDPPSRLQFTCEKQGKNVVMTVANYFSTEKGYRIKYPNLNCVWVGPREKCIYYPMELLHVSYGQARNRQLNDKQLANMVREAATPPADRKRKIEEVAACMNYSSNTFFKKFGLEISNKFLEVDAKILTPPNLDCGDRGTIIPKRGSWQANRLVKPEALVSWGFIAIDCDPTQSNYETIRGLLMNTGRQMGMDVAEPKMRHFNVRINELRNILFSALENEVRFLFIIVSARGRDTYHRVKQMAERDVGILTQCIKENTASRRMNVQTIKNILLKVNSKLMGVNQVLDARNMPNCLKNGDVMIVGADVTHPSPDQKSVPSIAAVTASMDAKAFSYNIELSIQTPKEEMIVEFADMLYDHLVLWRERNRSLPRKIYVFRDGVSEGQFAEVMKNELSAVHKAYQRFGSPNRPEVLFLLVQKRHHTRFFTVPQCANVEPGTVVDTHIVHPKELDFYLVSHQAIKGTARPTRYHAVCNDGNIPQDEVEQLTYYLCHLYSRCMRAVSYPTPTYYAHLACFRAKSLTFGQTFDNAALEKKPQRLRVLDKMLKFSRMFFV